MDNFNGMQEKIKTAFAASLSVHHLLCDDEKIQNQLASLAQCCLICLKNHGRIIFAGNGGSFADAQHLAAEFVSRLQFDRDPMPSIALGTNNSCMSAIGNDYGFDQIFAREIRALGRPGDVFIPISTSGNSPNILAAVEAAKKNGLQVFGMTGKSGGKLIAACQCLCVPVDRTERIQEGHILLGHVLCALIESIFFKND